MATSRKREIRDQDVQGLKCLRKIRPLLSRLRKVGTERDRAGNRRLFMDQYCALILMSLFSPAIESLRDLQRACGLDKVRKRLGVSRVSLGSLSESVAIFDPAPLKEIAIELGHTIRSKPNSQFAAVGQPIMAVDGTIGVVASLSTSPVTLTAVQSANSLTLTWPADHTGWRLQVQTNPLSAGLGTNWFDLGGTATTNSWLVQPDTGNGSVFYRLIFP